MGDRAQRARGPWLGLLLAGTALWGLYRVARPEPAAAIVVTAETVDALASGFERERGRSPTEAERDALVQDWVDREILVREGRARGLDRADPIVRRRMVQVMGFALEGEVPADPGDEVLEAWVRERADDYRRLPRRGFSHVFVAGRDEAARVRAEALQQALNQGLDPSGQGDPFAHGTVQEPASRTALAARYGDELAAVVEAAPRDRWVLAPSAFGWHALRVDSERPGELPPLSEIRARVLADWTVEQRALARREGLERLRESYQVRVER